MQVILKTAEGTEGGPHLEDGCYIPPLKAFMGDMTALTTSEMRA